MRILLIGNYKGDGQESMLRFGTMMREGLEVAGLTIRFVQPPVRLPDSVSRILPSKYAGYIDKFVCFAPELVREIARADVVHILDQGNAMYSMAVRGKPVLITCHDVLAIRSARGQVVEHQTRWSGKLLQSWVLAGLRRAQMIAAVSAETRRQLWRYVDGTRVDVRVVPNALNYPYSPMSSHVAWEMLDTFGVPRDTRYLLHVGNNSWYKNRDGLLRIFAEFSREASGDWRLVLAGKALTDELRNLASQLGIQHKLHHVGTVTNEELRALYSNAQALLFPSHAEGFGWPIIEAQACGCPVVTTGRSPMTEVGADAAIYIDPGHPRDAALTMLQNLPRREKITRLGLLNAERFSREQMVKSYRDLYHSLSDRDVSAEHSARRARSV